MLRHAIPVALLAIAVQVEGAELSDVRVSLGPGTLPTELALPFGTDRYDAAWGGAATIGGMAGTLAPIGLIWGAEGRYLGGETAVQEMALQGGMIDADDLEAAVGDELQSTRITQTGLAGLVGLGVQLSQSCHVEAVAILGWNWTTFERAAVDAANGTSFITTTGRGQGSTVGGRVGAFWTGVESHWQIGIQGECTRNESHLDIDYIQQNVTGNIDYVSFAVFGTVGYRL